MGYAYVVNGSVIKVLGGDGRLDDLLQDLLADLLGGDIGAVLGGHNNSVYAQGDDGTIVVLVLDGDLGLGIGAEPRERPVATSGGHGSVELVGELKGQGEQLGGLVGRITEHDALVTSTEVLEAVVEMEALGDIG